jgi:predicted secreted hydrolase
MVFPQVAYWEGLVDAEGRVKGQPVRGRGYVELTGYAGPLRGLGK